MLNVQPPDLTLTEEKVVVSGTIEKLWGCPSKMIAMSRPPLGLIIN